MPGTRDVVVVGLGALGSAASWWAARHGLDVLAVEQFELGHVRSSSHGHSRVVRSSHPPRSQVLAANGAFDAWREVEVAADTELVTTTGGVDLYPVDSPADPDLLVSALWAASAAFELVDGDEVTRRWPVFGHGRAVTSKVRAVTTSGTGLIPPGRATLTLQRLASDLGAELRSHAPVRELRPAGDVVEVLIDGDEDVEVVRARHVVLAAGAWTDRLLAPLGVSLGVRVTREQSCWFPHARLGEFALGRLPVWTWHGAVTVDGSPVYGVTDAVKCVERPMSSASAGSIDPERRSHEPDAFGERRVAHVLGEVLGPGAGVPRTTTWVAASAADGEIVCDRVPGVPRVSVGLGPADGFMFSAWLGRETARIAAGEDPGAELASFSCTRAGLTATR
jgi:sarcosine oxidase